MVAKKKTQKAIVDSLELYMRDPSIRNYKHAKDMIRTLDDFKTVIYGKTMLWRLAEAALLGKPKLFNHFWKEMGRKVRLEDLLFAPKNGSNVFTCLFRATWHRQTNVFFRIWSQFRSAVTMNILTDEFSVMVDDVEKNVNILNLLSSNPDRELFSSVISDILEDVPGWIVPDEISPTPAFDREKVKARNALLDALENPTPDYALIWSRAAHAHNQKYLSAFYEAGLLYQSRQYLDMAAAAYAYVPETSRYYLASNQFLMQYYLTWAKNTPEHRREWIEKALTAYFKTKLGNPPFLHEVAYCYIYGGEQSERRSINWNFLFQFITPRCSVEMCFQMFDTIIAANKIIESKDEVVEKVPDLLFSSESKRIAIEAPEEQAVPQIWIDSYYSPTL